MKPIIPDQYTAARAYFLCVIGLLFLESLAFIPSYLSVRFNLGRPFTKRSTGHSKLRTIIHKLKTLPSPIPIITNYNITDLLRFGSFVGLNILWGWNSNVYSTDYKLYGWLTISNGGLALLLASRTNLLTIVARIPSSTLLLYHRWIGIATMVHATIHFALNTRHYIATDQLADSYANTRIRIGIMAWLSLCLISITSLTFIRRRWFEVFYYSHALFFVFVVGALIHATKGPEFLLPGLLLWVIDRGIRFSHNFRPITLSSFARYPGDVVKLKFEGIKASTPGQVAWIQITGVSFVNWHPFTVVSAPGEQEVAVAIRGLGGYTKQVQQLASDGIDGDGALRAEEEAAARIPTCKFRLDGPYSGGGTEWGYYPVTVLVAGGIGITPGISIATHVVKRATSSALRTSSHKWHIHLLWVVKDLDHSKWFEEELRTMAALASDPTVPVTFDLSIYATQGIDISSVDSESAVETEVQSPPSIEMKEPDSKKRTSYSGPGMIYQGRPDLIKWFQDVKNVRPGMDAAVNACGPRSLIDNVRKAAAKASSQDGFFYVDEEVFEL